MLTTVQQAAFGFGSALLGTILYQTFEMTQSHQTAIATVLIAEFGLMLALVIAGLFYRRRLHNL
jgi:uncharacterized membrane protein YeaQ/YmgE (transglycosylase-associated protein family)